MAIDPKTEKYLLDVHSKRVTGFSSALEGEALLSVLIHMAKEIDEMRTRLDAAGIPTPVQEEGPVKETPPAETPKPAQMTRVSGGNKAPRGRTKI